jgi:hypothetical protein
VKLLGKALKCGSVTTVARAVQIAAPPLALRGPARRRVSLLTALFLTAFSLAVVLSPGAARAQSQDPVDIAFTVMSPALLAAGITPEMQGFARGLVQCAIERGATPLACARKALVRTLPEQARPFADCLLQGGSAGNCAIGALPPEVRGLAECIALADKPAGCATNRALSEAQRRAFATVGKLDSDPRGTLQSIIGVAEGIRDNDWAKVVSYGGEEAAKLAAKILYKALFPPLIPLAPLLDPAIDATISYNAGRVRDLIDAARRGTRPERREPRSRWP